MAKSKEIDQEKQKQQISRFLEHFSQGKVCVHPTDTVPGLSCDPRNQAAVHSLEHIKKRTQKKSFVGLLSSFQRSLDFWQPLPEVWRDLIPKIWPQPITFVWKARKDVPSCMVSQRGEIALRHPRLDPRADWFLKVMESLDFPLPSTSINYEGGDPILGAKELADFCQIHGIYLPEILPSSAGVLPSSVVRIVDDTHYEWLRVGAFSKEDFLKIYPST